MNRPFIRCFAIATTVLHLFFGAFLAPAAASERLLLPKFTIYDANGKALTIEDFKGKALVLNFWATWCGPCVYEMPVLSKLQKTYADKGLLVVAVAEDTGGGQGIDGFYKKHGIDNLPVYMDNNMQAFSALGLSGLPNSFIIGRDGKAITLVRGYADWDSKEIIDEVERALK